eukprot:COSAG01_NODE_2100_length_8429_cov_29.066507_13_plen_72_part_00
MGAVGGRHILRGLCALPGVVQLFGSAAPLPLLRPSVLWRLLGQARPWPVAAGRRAQPVDVACVPRVLDRAA